MEVISLCLCPGSVSSDNLLVPNLKKYPAGKKLCPNGELFPHTNTNFWGTQQISLFVSNEKNGEC